MKPTPKQIDELIAEYAEAQKISIAFATAASLADVKTDELKKRVTAMVEEHGVRHTEKSKRLVGNHNTATTTTGTRVAVDGEAVESFRTYLAKKDLEEISGRFFVASTTYSLVSGPQEVLKTLDLTTRIRDKVTSLLGLCFKIKTNAPSLKIETVEAKAA